MEEKRKSSTKKETLLIKNLVFQGGSVRGIAYMGAYQAAIEEGLITTAQIERIAGTSAGAITALLLSLGYSVQEIKKELQTLDFKSFLDEQSGNVRGALFQAKASAGLPSLMGIFASRTADSTVSKASDRLVHQYGLFEGEVFREWAEARIRAKTNQKNLTFAELHALHQKSPDQFKDLYVVGVNLASGMSEVFSHEHEVYANMVIADAVRISMSIPFLFCPHKIYIKDKTLGRVLHPGSAKDLYIDGGVMDNYPLFIFDKKTYLHKQSRDLQAFSKGNYANPQTLGFRLVDKQRRTFLMGKTNKLSQQEITGFMGFTKGVLAAIYQKQESDHVRSEEQNRTIYIDTCGINLLDFDLTADQQDTLIASGQQAVKDFLQVDSKQEQRKTQLKISG